MEKTKENSPSVAALVEKDWSGDNVERVGKFLVKSVFSGDADITDLMILYVRRVASLKY